MSGPSVTSNGRSVVLENNHSNSTDSNRLSKLPSGSAEDNPEGSPRLDVRSQLAVVIIVSVNDNNLYFIVIHFSM